jgi:hypothetical protein
MVQVGFTADTDLDLFGINVLVHQPLTREAVVKIGWEEYISYTVHVGFTADMDLDLLRINVLAHWPTTHLGSSGQNGLEQYIPYMVQVVFTAYRNTDCVTNSMVKTCSHTAERRYIQYMNDLH